MRNLKKIFQAAVLISLMSFPIVGQAQEKFDSTAWKSWKTELVAHVIKKGIAKESANGIINNLEFDPVVLEKDSNQPSRRYTFPEYKKKAVNQGRIDRGRVFYQEHKKELDHYAKKYGVSAPVIVALLGMETDYGGYTGTYDVLNSLATLAYGSVRDTPKKQNGRRNYFRAQIYYAIKMLDENIVERADFKGSWAGAFGINQHMPESFFAHVIDGDGDGDLEILNKGDLSDVFATTANHLKKVGWKDGYRWGRDVLVPDSIEAHLIKKKTKKTLKEWASMGITLPDSTSIPVVSGMKAALVVPKGMSPGQGYLAYDNFFAFKRWNNSDYFALAVGSLANEIAGLE